MTYGSKNKRNALLDRSMSPVGNSTCNGSPHLMTGTGWGAAARQSADVAVIRLKPWSDYAIDQATWRISIGIGTQADKAAVAAQG